MPTTSVRVLKAARLFTVAEAFDGTTSERNFSRSELSVFRSTSAADKKRCYSTAHFPRPPHHSLLVCLAAALLSRLHNDELEVSTIFRVPFLSFYFPADFWPDGLQEVSLLTLFMSVIE